MKRYDIDSNYCYCSGVACPIKKMCRRFLPDPPDRKMWWVPPAYKEESKSCPYYEAKIPNNTTGMEDRK